ncbi:phytoene desaturase family protein [Rubrobacter taiwanensis]|uniref:phytoene desaturase family protein n=1 Tax=Rubrobacter taiwanensis TaxID=185139 RepID=UPI00140515B3|nr:phytoene desaturase family protein [Rubrobacter taiwanensis]
MSGGRVAVVGAGVGGLAAAIRLRAAGFEVEVFEKNPEPGGRMGVLRGGGFTFDTGPTLLLMTDVYRELFRSAGRRLEDYVELVPLEPNYRVHFGDGDSMLVSRSLPQMVAELERIEPGSAPGYYRFLEDACRKYRVGRREFVERDFERARDFFSPRNLRLLKETQAVNNYYRSVSRFFRSEKLRQAFSFQTMYLGLSPFDAPAVYALLPYTELAEDGLWYPRGGMYRLVEAMCALAEELGVGMHLESPVEKITVVKGRAAGVRVNGGEFGADAVLANADLPYVYRNLLPERALRDFTVRPPERLTYTASAFMLYLGLEGRLDHLSHHNVYLSRDYRRNFEAIFRDRTLPEDPSLYTCVPARTDPEAAPEGRDALYVLVPVPHLDSGVDWNRERDGFREKVLALLEGRAGIENLRRRIVFEVVRTPEDWRREYNLEKGAAFGLGHGILQVGYFRPAIASRHIERLYFAGASTRPGTGVPLVTIGARLAAERIRREVAG